jgi:phosphatidylserine decarboxylase
MPDYPHPLIAREGWPFIAVAVAAALALHWAGWHAPAALVWVVVAFMVQFFRDPAREVPAQRNVVVSPADGRIVKVGRARDPWLERDALLISVFMNVFNVHSNRSPVDGTVRGVWYHAGAFVNAALDKASTDNERNALHLVTPAGADVTCVQVAGLIARRILCYAEAGDTLLRGQRYGFIRFGSRVDVYLPLSATPKVAIGDRVLATESILAELA